MRFPFQALLTRSAFAVCLAGALSSAGYAENARVTTGGTTSFPAMDVPSSPIMSAEGNQSRVEHILTERSLKGKPIAEFNAALFGPRLERTKAAFPVTIRSDLIGLVGYRCWFMNLVPGSPGLSAASF